MTAALLALCACGAAVPAVLAEDTRPVETAAVPTDAPTPEPTDAPTPEPTDAPTPAPPETPEPTEEPTPEPSLAGETPSSWEDLQRTLYETDSFCAALYLGRSSASLSDALPGLLSQHGLDGIAYLTDIAISNCVEQPGDEVFILIPRGDKTLSLYNYVLETRGSYDAYPGALLYSAGAHGAVAVRCNESDVRPNVLAVFSGLDGEQSFSPRITLADDTLLPAPGVYVLVSAF